MKQILLAVGERIRDIRKAKGFSQEQLGERAGFHFSYIGGLERGERNISLTNLLKISTSLNINLQELFDFSSINIVKEESKQTLMNEVLFLLDNYNESELKMIITFIEAVSKTFKSQ